MNITGTSTGGASLSVPSVNLLPNPAGATPGQIQSAAEVALASSGVQANVASTLTHADRTRNAVGYMVGTGGDTRLLGIKPRSTNYNTDDNYRDNT